MLDESLRTTILCLHEQGHGSRAIAEALGISRGAVKKVLRDGRAEVQRLARTEKAEPYRDQILELYAACKGNLVRVHEELTSAGAELSYQALTGFCRRHGIGHEPVRPAGQYVFKPGEEMQHDTSPHRAMIGGKERAVHTAALVLCFSRMIFMQMYPRFTRFECKLFLTEAIKYFGGACARTMIDNTHVIVASGTGRDMVPAPEMEALGERLGTEFRAHAVGNANRSGGSAPSARRLSTSHHRTQPSAPLRGPSLAVRRAPLGAVPHRSAERPPSSVADRDRCLDHFSGARVDHFCRALKAASLRRLW